MTDPPGADEEHLLLEVEFRHARHAHHLAAPEAGAVLTATPGELGVEAVGHNHDVAPATTRRARPGGSRRLAERLDAPLERLTSSPRGRALTRVAGAGAGYLAISVVLWWHVWTGHPSAMATCECGDPSLFLWFLEWPAYALTHGHSFLSSTAMFHGTGVNLLANTSVLGIGVPLIPVTLVFGPVATLNLALTLAPALSAASAFWLIRRWVRWTPAAFLGGLVYGFSPFVLEQLAYAHLMTAALCIPPLVVACLEDLLLRHRHRPRRVGVVLAVLLVYQFFISTEVLLIMAISLAIGLVILAAWAYVADRPALSAVRRPFIQGVGTAGIISIVVLAFPAWYALDGPYHFSGAVWPELPLIAGFSLGNYFHSFGGLATAQATPFEKITGYLGRPLPSSAYIGIGLPLVLAGGLARWRRDRRLWFLAASGVAVTVLSIGNRNSLSVWGPVEHLPLLDNIGQQRFVIMATLAMGAMLAIVLDHARADFSRWVDGLRTPRGTVVASVLAAVALVPILAVMAPSVPLTVAPTFVPAWYAQAAPSLGPDHVVLTYPLASSGLQSAMAWQAIEKMPVSIAGGGGPASLPARAGPALDGLTDLTDLAVGLIPANPTPVAVAQVRRAMRQWGVTDVVVTGAAGQSNLVVGKPPAYAAGYMTAVLGRLPTFVDDAWVWSSAARAGRPLHLASEALYTCYADAVVAPHVTAMTVPQCVLRAAGGARR